MEVVSTAVTVCTVVVIGVGERNHGLQQHSHFGSTVRTVTIVRSWSVPVCLWRASLPSPTTAVTVCTVVVIGVSERNHRLQQRNHFGSTVRTVTTSLGERGHVFQPRPLKFYGLHRDRSEIVVFSRAPAAPALVISTVRTVIPAVSLFSTFRFPVVPMVRTMAHEDSIFASLWYPWSAPWPMRIRKLPVHPAVLVAARIRSRSLVVPTAPTVIIATSLRHRLFFAPHTFRTVVHEETSVPWAPRGLLRKNELQAILKEFGQNPEGSVEELRSRLAQFANQPGLPKHISQRLADLEMLFGAAATPDVKSRSRGVSPALAEENPMVETGAVKPINTASGSSGQLAVDTKPRPRGVSPAPGGDNLIPGLTNQADGAACSPGYPDGPGNTPARPAPAEPTTFIVPPQMPAASESRNARDRDHFLDSSGPRNERLLQLGLADRLRKWGVFFSGGAADPLRFIEHLESMVSIYQLDMQQQLMPAIAGLLTGEPADWFRVGRLEGATWEEFKKQFLAFFLPPRYFQRLHDEIRDRTQRDGESFTTYLLSLRVMMRRAKYNEEQELYRVYDNLLPEYQMFTTLRAFERGVSKLAGAVLLGLRPTWDSHSRLLSIPGLGKRHPLPSARGTNGDSGEHPTAVKSPLRYEGGRIVASITIEDTPLEEAWINRFLQEELLPFDQITGVSPIAEHTIVLRDNRPIKQRYYPKNPAMQKIIDAQVDELLRDGRIEPSKSPHSAPIVLVAPATFQRELDGVIGPEMELYAFAYLDDIIVIGATLEEHANNLRDVLKRLRKANLRLNKNKCSFFQKSIVYLGHVVSEAGIHTDPREIDAIRELLPPTNVKELRRCLARRKATTAHLERSFRERILAWFGVPKIFVCDNGTQFTSRAFKTYCNQLGMTLQHTAPYSQQQNPTEHAKRTVKTMMSQYLDGEQSSWDTLLPEISLAINSSKSDSNGFSPAYMVQGREPRLPGMLYHEVTPSLGTEAQQPDDKARHLQEIFKVAKENMQRATAEQSRHYNLRRR
ncbi:hypothetical protein ACLKA7_007760 [Drosophila subpalustris]